MTYSIYLTDEFQQPCNPIEEGFETIEEANSRCNEIAEEHGYCVKVVNDDDPNGATRYW